MLRQRLFYARLARVVNRRYKQNGHSLVFNSYTALCKIIFNYIQKLRILL